MNRVKLAHPLKIDACEKQSDLQPCKVLVCNRAWMYVCNARDALRYTHSLSRPSKDECCSDASQTNDKKASSFR